MELDETLAHYLYNQTSAMVTNCVKSIPISQTAGQKLLAGCYSDFKQIIHGVTSPFTSSAWGPARRGGCHPEY